MTNLEKKVLFCGLGVSAQAWYRCALPANYLNQDWIGIVNGPPGEGAVLGGNIETPNDIDIDKYDIFVIELANGENWEKFIKENQKKGKKFIFEVDDFLHGVRKVKNHSNAKGFHKKAIKGFQRVMNLCDGMICSTEFLSNQYKKYNENQFVCKNQLDVWRYETLKPEHNEKVIVGWSGGTGHDNSILEALKGLNAAMECNDNILFYTTSYNYAQAVGQFHPDRVVAIPWVSLENYPFVIGNFDISLAPGHESKYHLSKSDLRWLEASASNVPVIGDKRIYHEIEDGETGFYAQTEQEYFQKILYLADQKEGEERREKISSAAKAYVVENRNMETKCLHWAEVFDRI